MNQNPHKQETLGQKVISGGGWLLTLKIFHRGLGFIRTIVLARLLSPEDFGLFGIALLFFNFLENFSVTGINTALIQKKGDISDYLDSAWTANLIRTFIIFSILFFSAPFVAGFFNSPDACNIIRAIAFVQILLGFENIGIIFFQKELSFNKVAYLKASESLATVIVSISLAVMVKSAWALVIGSLAGYFIRLVMSYVLHPYRPRLKFDSQKIKELLDFGKWLFGSSILVFLITEGDDIVVGKILGVSALGFYQMGYLLSNISATEISNLIGQITFPVYSKIQDDIERLKKAYLKVLQFVTFLCFPISGFLFYLAPEFTTLFLGEKWLPMVPAMQILALWGLIRAIGTTTTAVFFATGRPDLSTKVKLSQLILIAIAIYPLTIRFGITGTSISIVIATLIPNIIGCYLTKNIIRGSTADFGKVIILPLVNTMIALVPVYFTKILFDGITEFLFSIFLGITVYICITMLFNRLYDYDMWFMLKMVRRSKGI